MAVNRKSAGVKIPDIFLRNDEDDTTTGAVTISKAAGVALELSGSDSDLRLSGASARFYLANSGGTVGTIVVGAANVVTWAFGSLVATMAGSPA